MKKIVLRADYSRRFPDPLARKDQDETLNIEHHVLLCQAKSLPIDIPKDINPREQNTDRAIYKKVKESLLDERDLSFHLKNKGITIIAHAVTYAPDKETVEILFGEDNGIVDGAHTYAILLENKNDCPDGQYVKIEILTGVPNNMVEFIAQGLNTSVQVQEMSLANLAKRFDWIKEHIKDEGYASEISYKENEEGQFDIREIIALLTLFNIDQFPKGEKHPKIAYVDKSACLELYTKPGGEESYKKLQPILKDILSLHDYVHMNAKLLYNDKFGGRGGALAFYQTRKRGKYNFIFSGKEGESKLYDGALYPILGAFRYLVEERKGQFYWQVGSFDNVKHLFDEVGAELINLTKNTSDSRGKNPNAIGKDDNHWDNLYKTVALAYLQKAAKF